MTPFEKFSLALKNLNTADSSSEIAYNFIMTFEAACSVIRQGLALPDIDVNDKRLILKKAYEKNLIQNPAWLKMLRISSKLKEDYTGSTIRAEINNVNGEYMRCFRELHSKLESKQMPTMDIFKEQK